MTFGRGGSVGNVVLVGSVAVFGMVATVRTVAIAVECFCLWGSGCSVCGEGRLGSGFDVLIQIGGGDIAF